jgi:phage-related protein
LDECQVADSSDWSLKLYTDARGREPVREFLNTLDLQTQARFDWSLEQLRQRNTLACEPLARHIEGRIWELRRESAGNIYRLLYTLLPGKRILILHGFHKKTQKTPRGEIEMARRRLDDFLRRSGED